MAEYIEREKAIKEIIDTYEYEFPTASGAFDEFATRIVPSVLKNIPAADVAPVRHGRWIPVDEKEDAYDCSVCDAMVQKRHDFCPKCGSKMDMNGFFEECDITERQKLIWLLSGKSIDTPSDVDYVADWLLSNGVAVL